MKILVFSKLRGCAVAMLVVSCLIGALNAASPDDHTVILREAKTVEDIVTLELQSARFAEQIANYNGLPNATSLLPVGTVLAIPRPYMESVDFGRIAYVKGDVMHSQSDWVVNPPVKGSAIYNGDVFQTGVDGFVSLSFHSGATVNLQPQSRVLVKDIDCAKASERCVIELAATMGQIHSEVTPRPDGEPPVKFSVETPFLSAAVRGTAFYVNLDQQVNRIGVTRGLVATEAGGANNDLPKGKGLAAASGVPATIVDLLQPPVLFTDSDEIMMSMEDKITWSVLDGADSYRAALARDALMSDSIVVELVERREFSPRLQPGDYHLQLAGIDSNEFLGLPSTKKIQYMEISESVKPVLEVLRRGPQVELTMKDYSGPSQLLIGESIDSENVIVRTVEDASELLVLQLDETRDWVFRTRKILGPYAVSVYSDYYVLEAN